MHFAFARRFVRGNLGRLRRVPVGNGLRAAAVRFQGSAPAGERAASRRFRRAPSTAFSGMSRRFAAALPGRPPA